MPSKPSGACPVCRRVGCTLHRQQRIRTYQEQKAMAAVLKQWIAEHGYWCPGFEREAHESHDLTVDHIYPVIRGGDPLGPMTVLCRSCNGRKGERIIGHIRKEHS